MKKLNAHLAAVGYLRRKPVKFRNGASWEEITRLLVEDSGLPRPSGEARGAGKALLRQLGVWPVKGRSGKQKKKKKLQNKRLSFLISDEFLQSYEWRKLRMQALIHYGAVCQCCGRSRHDGIIIHVDHIKPRRKYPDLVMDFNNLQVLCHECNHGKGNWDESDWRHGKSPA